MVIMLISDYGPINMCTESCRASRESGTSARTQRKKSSWAVFRQNNTKENKVSGQWDSIFFLDQQAFVGAAFLPTPCKQKASTVCRLLQNTNRPRGDPIGNGDADAAICRCWPRARAIGKPEASGSPCVGRILQQQRRRRPGTSPNINPSTLVSKTLTEGVAACIACITSNSHQLYQGGGCEIKM